MNASLRELLTAATPPPWKVVPETDWEDAYVKRADNQAGEEIVAENFRQRGGADAALVVSLRNQAELLLDVVEAAQAVRDGFPFLDRPGDYGGAWVPFVEALDALSRLAATEPQAEQGGNRVA